jgi:predicted nucleic acid-binding protein
MSRQRIYVETTIPSAYYTNRPGAEMARRRDETRRWWKEAIRTCELVASAVVLRELQDGTSEHVPFRLALVRDLDLLDVTASVNNTADVYMRRKLMPADPPSDALHVALASHYNCDVLVTWNFRHLANANKREPLRVVNAQLGLPMPLIATPRQLLGGDNVRI